MSSQTWNQASPPQEWTSGQHEFGAVPQPSASAWTSHGFPVNAQDLHAWDTASWMNASSGPVEQGLSPVLSYKSHSTHTLNSFSETDASVLPPNLDLSFTTEPSWNVPAPVMYQPMPGVSHPNESFPVAAGYHHHAAPHPGMPIPLGYYQGVQSVNPLGGQFSYPVRMTQPPLAPKRPLLPRTEGVAKPVTVTHGPHRVLRPSVQGLRNSCPVVSSQAGQPSQSVPSVVAAPTHPGNGLATTLPVQDAVHGTHGIPSPPGYAPYGMATQEPSSAPAPTPVDPIAQEFSDFIHYDQEDPATTPAQTRSEHAMNS